ncbi:MAG: hypothetical protein ABIJ12_06610 [bacterium]
MSDNKNNINLLYTNIGRGHPFYLDGIIEALIKKQNINLIKNENNVFELSHGTSLFAWKTARWMYKKGSSPGILSWLYKKLRSERKYSGNNRLEKYFGRDLIEYFNNYTNPILVAHPLLVSILKGRKGLIYQHGELAAPEESLVSGADFVFVPTGEVARKFIASGYHKDNIIITGLCIEPAIVKKAEDAYMERIARLVESRHLTGAFFSSGGEPSTHVYLLSLAAASAVKAGGKALIFAKKGGKLELKVKKILGKSRINSLTIDSTDNIPHDLPDALIVTFQSRREENILTAHFFQLFDYLVAPAHERSNWAVGLGLPHFILKPNIGPFAPLNAEFLMKSGVSEEIVLNIDANLFGAMLGRYQKSGKLIEMAQNGWNKYKINGFFNIADFLINKFK